MQGNRFRFQAFGADQSQLFSQIFNQDMFVFQGPFQGLPGKVAAQQIQDLNDQITAVGPMERPGADHGEIRKQGAELGFFFNTSEQVGIRGIGFVNDRGPLGFGMIHQHIDFIAGKGRFHQRSRKGAGGSRLGFKIIDIFDYVFFNLLEVLQAPPNAPDISPEVPRSDVRRRRGQSAGPGP